MLTAEDALGAAASSGGGSGLTLPIGFLAAVLKALEEQDSLDEVTFLEVNLVVAIIIGFSN